MDAIFCREKKTFDAQIKDLNDIGLYIQKNHYRFCEYDESLDAIPNGKDTASFYGILGETQKFSTIVMGKDFNLFPSQWCRSFLSLSFHLLKEGGIFVVPIHPKNDDINGLSLGYLESFLGKSLKETSSNLNILNFLKKNIKKILGRDTDHTVSSKQPYAFFKKEKWERKLETISVLDIFIENKKDFIGGLTTQLQKDDTKSDADAILQHAYYVGGMRYKSPLTKYIISQYLENKKPKKIVDMGAGYGLLGTELLLDSDLNVQSIINCDINEVHKNLHDIIHNSLPIHCSNKTQFIQTSSEEYDFGYDNDVISFIGSLLYVDRAFVQKTLQKAFDSLSKGGILIIHENIKHPNYVTDFKKMFTVEELESYLKIFGEISYYSSVVCKKLDKNTITNNTVFRVLQKL